MKYFMQWAVMISMAVIVSGTANAQSSMDRPQPFTGVRIVPLQDQPIPDALKAEAQKRAIAIQTQEIVEADKGEIPDFDEIVADRGHLLGPLEVVQTKLHIKPVSLQNTELRDAEVIGAIEAGKELPTGWTSVTRVLHDPRLGYVILGEWDYVASGGGISLSKESINAYVNGYPATLMSLKTPDGKTQTSLTWVTDKKSYELKVKQVGADAKTQLLEIAQSIKEEG